MHAPTRLDPTDAQTAVLDVRNATREDVPFLADCNIAMAFESEGKRLDREVLTRGITAVFDHPERGFYLVAEREGRAVGSLLITHEWSD